ncbi:unnamed protein product, partial [Mesorhabditis belari]|uniref:Protein FAM184A/B N-terminal domain-containing protein n=1 Tax=Mesorhabditis belari TaxID=2138241 RepID=A0AAF3FHK4_9BILA
MSERLTDRLGVLCMAEDLEARLSSPHGSRRSSRSPRPHAERLSHCSHPTIAAWPAPPPKPDLVSTHQKLQLCGSPPSLQSSIIPPSIELSSPHLFGDPSSGLLSILKVPSAASSPIPGTLRIRENELQRKIQSLEDTVAEYERQKYNVMGTFSEYKERVTERERKLEAEYSTKILSLSEEVLGAKKDFEQRMKSFQALQDKFEREKELALEKLRKEHQKEIRLLEARFSDGQLLNLEQKYILEIRRLEEERKSLRSEKERLGETFEMKLRRAQSLYETELAAAKMLYAKELEALKDHEFALKAELAARQDEFNDRLNELQNRSRNVNDELRGWKNEVTALQKKLRAKEGQVDEINRDLAEARRDLSEAHAKLNRLTSECAQEKAEATRKADELKNKYETLVSVESARNELQSVIVDLNTQVKTLKNKVEFLEKERTNLQSQSESQTHVHDSQVHALEAMLDTVTKEKESTKENYEKLLAKEKQQAEAREHAMKKEFSTKLNELEEQYNALKEDLEHSARADRDELREATAREMDSLRAERDLLESQFEALKEQIDGENAENSVDPKLQKILDDASALREQIDAYRKRIIAKEAEIDQLKEHLHQENQVHADQLMVIRDEIRLELLASNEFSGKTTQSQIQEKMAELELLHDKDCDDLQKRIEELEAELERLRQEKENERKMLREESFEKSARLEDLEIRVKALLSETAQLKDDLKVKTQQLEDFADRIDERPRDVKNNEKIKELNEAHEKEKEALIQKNRELEARLRALEEKEEKEEAQKREVQQEILEEISEEKAASSTDSDSQTDLQEDERNDEDLRRENELSTRIADLEKILEQKKELINELQSQISSRSSSGEGDSSEEREKERSPEISSKNEGGIREKSPPFTPTSRQLLCVPGGSFGSDERTERRSPSRTPVRAVKRDEKRPAWKF